MDAFGGILSAALAAREAARQQQHQDPTGAHADMEEEQEDRRQSEDPSEKEEAIKMEESRPREHDDMEDEKPTVKQEEDVEGNEGDDEETGDQDNDSKLPKLGGKIEKEAFCLLDGVFEQKDGKRQRVTIPVTRLPAVLGRSHSTGDINFFSLGPAKALSRQHCKIDYRVKGGRLVTPKSAIKDTEEEGSLEYKIANDFWVVNPPRPPSKEDGLPFPDRGAFCLEALGKNLIMVGNHRMKQGEIAILSSGTPIRMSAYSLYFLLPTGSTDPPKTMDIPIEGSDRTNSIPTNDNPENKQPSSPSSKKTASGGFKRKIPGSVSPPESSSKAKKPKAAPFSQLQAELDALPIETLLERMNEAVESERWERKHQLIGSTISLHAVKDATSAPEIREQAADGGVARTEIMRWIKESPKYADWVEQMNSKMEAKSYQNTITKALLKAGNVRTGSGGRYIKWILPGVTLRTDGEGRLLNPDKPPSGKATEEEGEEENEDENDDDDDGAGDEEEEDENDQEEGEGEHDEDEEDEKTSSKAGAHSSFAEQREEDSDGDDSVEGVGDGFGATFGGGEPESGNEGGDNEESSSHAFGQDHSMEETEGGGQ